MTAKTGASRRQKGHAAERELLRLLGERLGLELSREYGQSDHGGSDCYGLPGISLEIKNQEKITLGSWWEQAVAGCRPDTVPVLAYRLANRSELLRWRIRLPLGTLCEIADCFASEDLGGTVEMGLSAFVIWYQADQSRLAESDS